MATFTSLLAALLVCAATVDQVYGCSCMPAHPQDQYCRSNFVIRAKVIAHRFIYEEEPQKEPTEYPTTQSAPTTKPDNYFDIDNEIPNEVPLQRFRKALLPLPPLPSLEEVERELPRRREPIMQVWKVKVIKLYKGAEYMEEKKYVELMTSRSGSLCGVSFLEMSNHYIITGSVFDDGVLRINTCGWIEDYNNISPRQKQGLKSGYSVGCGDCTIQTCFGGCTTSPDICAWTPYSCETDHSKCIRKKKGKCGWHTNKHLSDCKG